MTSQEKLLSVATSLGAAACSGVLVMEAPSVSHYLERSSIIPEIVGYLDGICVASVVVSSLGVFALSATRTVRALIAIVLLFNCTLLSAALLLSLALVTSAMPRDGFVFFWVLAANAVLCWIAGIVCIDPSWLVGSLIGANKWRFARVIAFVCSAPAICFLFNPVPALSVMPLFGHWTSALYVVYTLVMCAVLLSTRRRLQPLLLGVTILVFAVGAISGVTTTIALFPFSVMTLSAGVGIMGLVPLTTAGVLAELCVRGLRRWRLRGVGPHCHRCGYNLTANVTGVCPECGCCVDC